MIMSSDGNNNIYLNLCLNHPGCKLQMWLVMIPDVNDPNIHSCQHVNTYTQTLDQHCFMHQDQGLCMQIQYQLRNMNQQMHTFQMF
jgi:hypothetical protein